MGSYTIPRKTPLDLRPMIAWTNIFCQFRSKLLLLFELSRGRSLRSWRPILGAKKRPIPSKAFRTWLDSGKISL